MEKTKRGNADRMIPLFSALLMLLSLAVLAGMVLILDRAGKRSEAIDQLESDRDVCVGAISQLSDASDYLTAEVWSYATGGEIAHLNNYCTEIETTRSRDKAVEQLLHSDLTQQERVHVLRAKSYSDALANGELWSLRLLAESYGVAQDALPARVRAVQLSPAQAALTPDAKRSTAQQYLFGAEYAQNKSEIRAMVTAFNTDLSARLAASTTAALAANKAANRYAVLAIALMMLLILVTTAAFSRTVARKNSALRGALADAQAASSAKSYFTSRMSHEIRTPLNAVLGYLHIAEHTSDDARRADSIAKSRIAATSLLGIVNDVLDLSAIESGKMQLAAEPYSVSGLIRELQTIYAANAENRGIHLSVSAEGLTQDLLVGDRMRLGQVFANLMSNALKFTPAGGSVEFTARQALAGGTAQMTYTVRDTGIGIAPEFLPHLFDAYEQEDPTIHQRFGGSGLGMSIAKSLIERMGGTIAVQSEKGRGSVFTVCLASPAADAAAQPPDTLPAGQPDSLNGMRILLAEDNEMNLEIACAILAEAGAAVTTAANGRLAVEAFLNSPPGSFDAILMDIIMPEMDGYEATRRIRSCRRPDAGSVPIIAMSANAFTSDVQQSLAAGMNAHTAKPIDIGVLLTTLRRFDRRSH